MIAEALSVLLGQLNQYLDQLDGSASVDARPAVIGNVAQLDITEVSNALENHLVLTLVNVAEETTLKNGRNFTSRPNGVVDYHNTPLHVNLFLLFTANFRNYETSLKRLSQLMTFFQGKRTFTPINSPQKNTGRLADFSLTLDLLSLNFEEVNHLWGSLGGKQLPFAAYEGRLITLQDDRVLEGGGYIREIEVNGRDATV